MVSEDGRTKMNDPDASNQRPPYWGRCEEMSFVELRKFIDHALKVLSDPNSDVELPDRRTSS